MRGAGVGYEGIGRKVLKVRGAEARWQEALTQRSTHLALTFRLLRPTGGQPD